MYFQKEVDNMNIRKEVKPKGRLKKNEAKEPYKKTNFCNVLNKLFGEKTGSQETVAKALGVSRQSFGNWLAGRNQPDYDTLIAIADYYGVSTDYLLGRTKNRTTTEDDKTTLATTGLTEKALENIKVLCHKSKHTIASNLPERTVSFFLESDNLIEIVRCLALAEIHFDILDPSPSIIKARVIQQLDDDKPSKSQKTLDEYSKLAVSALCSEGYSPVVELKLHEAVSKLLYSFKEELEHGKPK